VFPVRYELGFFISKKTPFFTVTVVNTSNAYTSVFSCYVALAKCQHDVPKLRTLPCVGLLSSCSLGFNPRCLQQVFLTDSPFSPCSTLVGHMPPSSAIFLTTQHMTYSHTPSVPATGCSHSDDSCLPSTGSL
jgi:hypothetical protein